MAHLVKFHWWSGWLIITCLLVKRTMCFNLSSADGSSKLPGDPKEFNNITLKRCCHKTDTTENEDKNSCQDGTEHLIVQWSNLKSHRIPIGYSDQNFEIQVSKTYRPENLNCDSVEFLTIPLWKPPENYSEKGFSAFFTSDGYLQFEEYIYAPHHYCVESISSNLISIVACNYSAFCTDPNSVGECFTRCCNHGEVWDISRPRMRCANSGNFKWKPEIHASLSNGDMQLPSIESPLIVMKHPRELVRNTCKGNRTVHSPHWKIQSHNLLKKKFGKRPILPNGTVWIKLRTMEWVQLHPGEYCIDGFQFGEGNFSGNSEESLLFECKLFETKEESERKEVQRKYSFGFGIILTVNLVLLTMTAIVYYIASWSKTIHSWTVFSYIMSLLVTYLLLGMSHFATVSLARNSGEKEEIVTFCSIIGILAHFMFIFLFSWSTVLNFDLYCTFRNLRPTTGQSSGYKKFIWYCLFSVVLPFSIVAFGLYLDSTYSNDVNSDIISPRYGKTVCYVEPRYARFYFIILPIAGLLGVNLILFGNTAYSLYRVKKSTEFASQSSSKSKSDNQTFCLILKLLLVNGSIWIVEIISWYLQTDYEEVGLVSFVLDVVNITQAVAIFFLFVFKNDVLNSLKRNYPSMEGLVNAAFKLKSCFGFSNSLQETGAANRNARPSSNTRTSDTNPRTASTKL